MLLEWPVARNRVCSRSMKPSNERKKKVKLFNLGYTQPRARYITRNAPFINVAGLN